MITNCVEVHANLVEGSAALWVAFQIGGPEFLKRDNFFTKIDPPGPILPKIWVLGQRHLSSINGSLNAESALAHYSHCHVKRSFFGVS